MNSKVKLRKNTQEKHVQKLLVALLEGAPMTSTEILVNVFSNNGYGCEPYASLDILRERGLLRYTTVEQPEVWRTKKGLKPGVHLVTYYWVNPDRVVTREEGEEEDAA
jgi:hypothetical protein